MNPFQRPINGNEHIAGLAGQEGALSLFYRAFNARDIALMRQSWLGSDDCSMDNPLGGVARGWPEIERIYRRIFEGDSRVCVEFFDYTLHAGADLFYAVGRERGELRGASADPMAIQIRTTRVFRRVDGVWRQVHHHGSIDDAALLQSYQKRVRGPA